MHRGGRSSGFRLIIPHMPSNNNFRRTGTPRNMREMYSRDPERCPQTILLRDPVRTRRDQPPRSICSLRSRVLMGDGSIGSRTWDKNAKQEAEKPDVEIPLAIARARGACLPVKFRDDGTAVVRCTPATARYLMSPANPVLMPLMCHCRSFRFEHHPRAHDLLRSDYDWRTIEERERVFQRVRDLL